MYIYFTVTKYLMFYKLNDILVKYKFTYTKYSILYLELFERITDT